MSSTAFDALKLARRLKGIGLPPEQADGFAEVFSEVMVTDLATKRDLADLEAKFRLECEKIRTEIAASRSEILRWILPLILAQMALTVGILLRRVGVGWCGGSPAALTRTGSRPSASRAS